MTFLKPFLCSRYCKWTLFIHCDYNNNIWQAEYLTNNQILLLTILKDGKFKITRRFGVWYLLYFWGYECRLLALSSDGRRAAWHSGFSFCKPIFIGYLCNVLIKHHDLATYRKKTFKWAHVFRMLGFMVAEWRLDYRNGWEFISQTTHRMRSGTVEW